MGLSAAERQRRWRVAHPELARERDRLWYRAHRDQVLARATRYREANQEAIQQRARQRYAESPAMLERSRRWRAEHREYGREYSRQWSKAHPDHWKTRLVYLRQWLEAHPERVSAYHKRSYYKDVEASRAYRRAWNATHAEAANASKRRWLDAHPGYGTQWVRENPIAKAAQTERRRIRKLGAPGTASKEAMAGRWQLWGGKCWMCGAAATSFDHVKPLAKGGSGWPANLRPACRSCNSGKRDRWPLAA